MAAMRVQASILLHLLCEYRYADGTQDHGVAEHYRQLMHGGGDIARKRGPLKLHGVDERQGVGDFF